MSIYYSMKLDNHPREYLDNYSADDVNDVNDVNNVNVPDINELLKYKALIEKQYEANRKWKSAHKDKMIEYQRKYNAKHKDAYQTNEAVK